MLKINKDLRKWNKAGQLTHGGQSVPKEGQTCQKRGVNRPTTKDNTKETIQKKVSELYQFAKTALLFFMYTYKNHVKEEYLPNFGKEIKLLKSVVKLYGLDKTKELIIKYFESDDKFIKEKAGYSVGVFYTQINKLHSKEMDRGHYV